MIVLLSEFNERASFQFDIIAFDASNKFNRERQNTELVVLQTWRAVGIDASQPPVLQSQLDLGISTSEIVGAFN